jgi:hypothetical protein
MSTAMHHFSSNQFAWKGNKGTAEMSELLGPGVYGSIGRFSITSARTGKTRFYELDSSAPGYEDGWDGEYKVYTDNLFDGTRIVILND